MLKKYGLELLATPLAFTTLWTVVAYGSERKKREVNTQQIYEDLKKDVVQVYQQSIDESKQQPLIDLLHRKRDTLNPELKKRLQILEEWNSSMWSYRYKFGVAVMPILISTPIFPLASALLMFGLSSLTLINVENDRQILSGGKQKSYFKKDIIPKQDQVIDGFKYFSYGLLTIALAKIGLLRYNKTIKKNILQEWKKNNQRK